jgi:hypothetical protein
MIHTFLSTYIPNEKIRLHIQKGLEANKKIDKVHFSDNPRHVGVTMNSYMTIDSLNEITSDVPDFEFVKELSVSPNFKEEIDTTGFINSTFGFVLLIIFIVSIVYTFFYHGGADIFYTLRLYFGLLIFIFGILKLKNYLDFTEAHQRYDIISKHFCLYAYIYPFLEIFLGLFLVMNFIPIFTYITLSMILFMRAIGVLYAIAVGNGVEYAYLEGAFKMRISYATLAVDTIIILFCLSQIWLLLVNVV